MYICGCFPARLGGVVLVRPSRPTFRQTTSGQGWFTVSQRFRTDDFVETSAKRFKGSYQNASRQGKPKRHKDFIYFETKFAFLICR